MSEKKQTLTPAEWKSVTDHIVEVSQQMAKVVAASPNLENGRGAKAAKELVDSPAVIA